MRAILCLFLLIVAVSLAALGSREEPVPESVRRGGTLKIGTLAVGTLDPHLATSISDIQLLEQVYEHLTWIGKSNRPAPELAATWGSPDGRSWTFTLRPGARFSDGRRVTAADVAFSFERLRDPAAATPVVQLFGGIREIEVLDESRIRFVLAEPNPEFASDVGDYHAAVIPAGSADPSRERIGSGPFMIDSWSPGTGVVLKPNPYYDRLGLDGRPLPYLDELRLVFIPELGGQVEALRRGELDYVGGLTAGMARDLRDAAGVRILTVDANMHWVIHLRADAGHATADNRVRQALKLATRHQALADAVRPGLASVGNGFTPVGPAFGMVHLVRPPFYDPRRARRLLAEAGYEDGLSLTLHVPNHLEARPIAELWKEQMAEIGVRVDLEVVSPGEYYGEGPDSWLAVEVGLTEWGDRVAPLSYFKLAYVTGAPWNETHWSDPEFDQVIRLLSREIRESRRVQLYHQAQEILIERGPIIVPYFVKAAVAINDSLWGVEPAPDWPRTRFHQTYYGR